MERVGYKEPLVEAPSAKIICRNMGKREAMGL